MSVQIPKGLFDLSPAPKEAWKSSHLWHQVESVFYRLAPIYGFEEIRTPIFEKTELFARGVGEETDVIAKEMYTFEDKGGRSMSLRPEGTAPVIRAFLGEAQRGGCHKLFYRGPMFRYERQQAGRYRQHHQFGVEVIGDGAPERDAEVIDFLVTFYTELGLKGLTVQLNSLGDADCRKVYRNALKDYLAGYLKELSKDSQERFEKNPLRILDSKDAGDRKVLEGAPSILDFLSGECREHFDRVQELLDIPFEVNPRLVRGLDYYTRTVFEVTAEQLGAQNSIGGGGRYDGLIAKLGGPDLPALGFGTGIERIVQTMLGQGVALPKPLKPELLLVPLGDGAREKAFHLMKEWRVAGIRVEIDLTGKKLKKSLGLADDLGVAYVGILGDEELNKGCLQLKQMESHTSSEVMFDQVVEAVR